MTHGHMDQEQLQPLPTPASPKLRGLQSPALSILLRNALYKSAINHKTHLPLRSTASSAATEEEKRHLGEIWPTKAHKRLHTAPYWQRKKKEQRKGRDCKRLEGKAAISFESSLSFSAW